MICDAKVMGMPQQTQQQVNAYKTSHFIFQAPNGSTNHVDPSTQPQSVKLAQAGQQPDFYL